MESSELGPLWRRSLKSSKNIPLRSIDVSTGRPFCQTEAVEMNGSRPTPIFATNFVSEECYLALRGFVSPLGRRARQTSMSGSLGTLALIRNAANPIDSPELGVIRKGVDGVNSFSHRPIITDSRHYPKLSVSASSTCSRK